MSAPADRAPGSSHKRKGRLLAWLLATGVVALLLLANAHLVYVAVGSQPDCVPHEKAAGSGMFRAARSAC
ncbi:hypothetical protein SAMN05428997_112125 [Bosea sp. CRIB-10]|uniref:hypothetical protein n=1 Tax=Bosea sp. CRIB-10 TaxID=378404 RepID=UPI0008F0006F|nr:hypothetical protein [Bosea sp. CRIB-10]SFC84946.1 hypothetical protein SAMN05428997_112125 [Bosea sp. CRIB-10]